MLEQSVITNAPLSVSDGYDALPKSQDSYIDKSQKRWLFSPFAYLDLSDRITGHAAMEAGVFYGVKNQGYRHHQTLPMIGNVPDFGAALAGKRDGFSRLEKTAFDTAKEIQEAYPEAGVCLLEGLAGIEDRETILTLQQALFGTDSLPFAQDTRLGENHPVPVLPVWLNRLNDTGRSNVDKLSGEARETCEKSLTELRRGISQAITYCTQTIEEAKGELAQGKLKRRFNRVERRCFLALGEQIPNDLPMAAGNQNQELVKELGEVFAKAMTPKQDERVLKLESELAEIKQLIKSQAKPEPKTETEKVACDFIKANNEQCKSFALEGLTRCTAHKDK